MTTEPSAPNPAPPPPTEARATLLSKPVLVAGVLGGVLGAVCSFALARALPAPVKVPPPAPPSEARQFADHVIGLLKAGDNKKFLEYLRPAYPRKLNDEQFAEHVGKNVFQARVDAVELYGASIDFEFCRELVLSPSLVRLLYLERFAHGCTVWHLIVYHSPDGWMVYSCTMRAAESGFTTLP
jgi:hypothetical protein